MTSYCSNYVSTLHRFRDICSFGFFLTYVTAYDLEQSLTSIVAVRMTVRMIFRLLVSVTVLILMGS